MRRPAKDLADRSRIAAVLDARLHRGPWARLVVTGRGVIGCGVIGRGVIGRGVEASERPAAGRSASPAQALHPPARSPLATARVGRPRPRPAREPGWRSLVRPRRRRARDQRFERPHRFGVAVCVRLHGFGVRLHRFCVTLVIGDAPGGDPGVARAGVLLHQPQAPGDQEALRDPDGDAADGGPCGDFLPAQRGGERPAWRFRTRSWRTPSVPMMLVGDGRRNSTSTDGRRSVRSARVEGGG